MSDFGDFNDYSDYPDGESPSWDSLAFAAGLTAGLMFLKYDSGSRALLILVFGPVAPWLLVTLLFTTLSLQLLIGLKLFYKGCPCEMNLEEKSLIFTLPFSACALSLLLTVVAFTAITTGWLVGGAVIGAALGALMSVYLYCKVKGIDMFPAAFKTNKLSVPPESNHGKGFAGATSFISSVPLVRSQHPDGSTLIPVRSRSNFTFN